MSEASEKQPLTPKIGQTFRAYAPILRRIRGAFQEAGAPKGPQARRAMSKLGREQLEERRKRDIDEVTGLPSRRVFEERLQAEIGRAKRRKIPLVWVIVDLNDLKTINDDPQKGYVAGDEALRTVANCLRSKTRIEDTVTRYGGDEDAVLLTEATREDVIRWWERVNTELETTPYTVTACAAYVNLKEPAKTIQAIGVRLLELKKQLPKTENYFELMRS